MNMEDKIRLIWNRKMKYSYSVFPKGKFPKEFGIEIKGDPILDSEDKCVANMGVWLDCGVIYHLFVQPTWRHKGIGTRLLKEGERKIIKLTNKGIRILVNGMNTNTVSFYEKNGYHMTDERMIGYEIMAKERKVNCRIPCEVCWKTDGEACFDKRCPKADLE